MFLFPSCVQLISKFLDVGRSSIAGGGKVVSYDW